MSKTNGQGKRPQSKGGRPRHTRNEAEHDLEKYLDHIVDWPTLIRSTYKLARGGHSYTNQYGNKVKALPNLDAIKFLFEHRFGRPDSRNAGQTNADELLARLREYSKRFVLPKQEVLQVRDETEKALLN